MTMPSATGTMLSAREGAARYWQGGGTHRHDELPARRPAVHELRLAVRQRTAHRVLGRHPELQALEHVLLACGGNDGGDDSAVI